MAFSSWQNTFTTFCPVIISSIKPFTSASLSCCVLKKALERLPNFVVVNIMTTAMTMLTKVRGMLSTTIEAKVTTSEMMLLNTCGRLEPIIWRNVSTSLV